MRYEVDDEERCSKKEEYYSLLQKKRREVEVKKESVCGTLPPTGQKVTVTVQSRVGTDRSQKLNC